MNEWNKLSMRDRAAIIRAGVSQGITDIDNIRLLYDLYNGDINLFSKGGAKNKKREAPPSISNTPVVLLAMKFFMDKGLSLHLAAGLVGNLYRESRFNTKALNSGSAAYGIALWLGSRKQALFKKYGNNPTLLLQLDFVWHELNTTHKRGLTKLKESKTAEEAARNAFGYYEFSAGPEGAIKAMNKSGLNGLRSMLEGIDFAKLLIPKVPTKRLPTIVPREFIDPKLYPEYFSEADIPQSTTLPLAYILQLPILSTNIPTTYLEYALETENPIYIDNDSNRSYIAYNPLDLLLLFLKQLPLYSTQSNSTQPTQQYNTLNIPLTASEILRLYELLELKDREDSLLHTLFDDNIAAYGGNLLDDDPVISYNPTIDDQVPSEFYNYMRKLAEVRSDYNHRYYGSNTTPLEVYQHMLNNDEGTYNFKRWYNTTTEDERNEYLKPENGGLHFADRKGKTILSPTFSEESPYSGYINPYNPYGFTGGYWTGELPNEVYNLSEDLMWGKRDANGKLHLYDLMLPYEELKWSRENEKMEDGTPVNTRMHYLGVPVTVLPEVVITAPKKKTKANKKARGGELGNIFDGEGPLINLLLNNGYSITPPTTQTPIILPQVSPQVAQWHYNLTNRIPVTLDKDKQRALDILRAKEYAIANRTNTLKYFELKDTPNRVASNDVTAVKVLNPTTGSYKPVNPELLRKAAEVRRDSKSIVGDALGAVPLVIASLPFVAAIAPAALANPYINAGLISLGGAHAAHSIYNGEADWMTALELAPFLSPLVGPAGRMIEGGYNAIKNGTKNISGIFKGPLVEESLSSMDMEALGNAYKAAVEAGDRTKALGILEEAYLRSGVPKGQITVSQEGFPVGWYHGSEWGNHSIFDSSAMNATIGGSSAAGKVKGNFLTTDVPSAMRYAGHGRYTQAEVPEFTSPQTFREKLQNLFGRYKPRRLYPAERVGDYTPKPERLFDTEGKAPINHLDKTDNVVYPMYVNPGENPMVLDFGGKPWSQAPVDFPNNFFLRRSIRDDVAKTYRYEIVPFKNYEEALKVWKEDPINIYHGRTSLDGVYFEDGVRSIEGFNSKPRYETVRLVEEIVPNTTNGAVQTAARDGNSSVLIRNVIDSNGGPKGVHYAIDDFVTLRPEQMKIADITYDDNGELIPLIERFNWNKRDSRWANGGKIDPKKLKPLPPEDNTHPDMLWHNWWLNNRADILGHNIKDTEVHPIWALLELTGLGFPGFDAIGEDQLLKLLSNAKKFTEYIGAKNTPVTWQNHYRKGKGIPQDTPIDELLNKGFSGIGATYPQHNVIVYPNLYFANRAATHERTHALGEHTPLIKKVSLIINDSYEKSALDDYFEDPKEIYARLMEFREHYNLNPKTKVTKLMLEEWRKKGYGIGGLSIGSHLIDRYDDDVLLRLFNEVADNNALNTNDLFKNVRI